MRHPSKDQSGSTSTQDGQDAGDSRSRRTSNAEDRRIPSSRPANAQQTSRPTTEPSQPSDQSSGGEQPRDSQQPGDREADKPRTPRRAATRCRSRSRTDGPQFKRDQQQPAANRPPQQADQRDTPPQSSQCAALRPPWNPTKILSTITSGIGNLLKFCFSQPLSLRPRSLSGSIASMSGRRWHNCGGTCSNCGPACGAAAAATDAEAPTPADQPAGPPVPLFASYKDPFASGTAERYTTEELVRYSFEVLEAWGREHDCPRGPRTRRRWNTPSSLLGHHAHIGPETQMLADLYCRVAYGREKIASHRRDHLRRLWQHLRQGV